MKKNLFLVFALFIGGNSLFGQGPFGTGIVNDVNIGVLDDADVEFASNTGWGSFDFFPDANSLLASYEFDLYIPPDYDGSEPYGIVTWINSGNNGAVMGSWTDVLDEKKLIWVGGNNIGNSIYINIRMGVAWAAILRMKELYNIDEDRIYTSGKSGGARMANTLAQIYPEWIDATLPLCGASYPIEVSQDYETYEPDSHYEIILPLTDADVAYIKTFDQRYGIMTSFGDFRQGDIMNIYHNGLEPDGFESRFLETTGGHCATTTAHFRDAVNFVEHNFTSVLNLESETGAGYLFTNVSNETDLILNGNTGELAQLKTLDLFPWNDPKGSIIRTRISLDDALATPENTSLDIALIDYQDGAYFCTYEGDHLEEGISGIRVHINFESGDPEISLEAESDMDGVAPVTLFTGQFSDWTATDQLDIKFHIWNNELRLEFSNHFQDGWFVETGAKLLDDKRSLRVRWNEVTGGTFWTPEQWENGTFLTMSSNKVDVGAAGGNIMVNLLSVKSDLPSSVHTLGTLAIEQSGANLIALDGGLADYQWYFNGTAIDGETSATLTDFMAYGDGTFYLSATYTDECPVTSNELSFDYSGIQESSETDLVAYPNPFEGSFRLEGLDENNFKLFDPLGKDVTGQLVICATEGGLLVDGSLLSPGLYFITTENFTLSILNKE